MDADDYLQARLRMVESQLARRGLSDQRVLEAMREVPRHLFVEERVRERAYHDQALPISERQTISQPYIVAVMTQALRLRGREKVLEVGSGSGYQAAVLSRLARQVITIERISKLAELARTRLAEMGYDNVIVVAGDGSRGWEPEAPYDAIMVTAATPELPEPLLDQLTDRGRLIAPVGDRSSQVLILVEKKGERLREVQLDPCVFVPLLGEHGW